jgi:hypothetical protein
MYRSLKKYDELLKQRNHPEFWAANIIEAESECESEEERRHFMTYIMNPKEYNADDMKHVVTLGDLEAQGRLVNDIKPYPKGMTTESYLNGGEVVLIVKTNTLQPVDEFDEKCPEE